MFAEYMTGVFWVGFMVVFIFSALTMGCIIIGALTWAMCSLMERIGR